MKRSELVLKYTDYMILRNYSPRTIKSYLCSLNWFLDYTQLTNKKSIDIQGYVKSFLIKRFKDGRCWSTVNLDYSALRILIVYVLGQPWDYKIIPRPKGKTSIPTVLSGRQAESMINATSNFKHKFILLLLYTTGMRISELINLDISHILKDRLQLKVENGKGGKSRIISLPKITVLAMQKYIELYRPKTILIEGNSADNELSNRYSQSSIRKIVNRSAKKVGINWQVSPHSLRYAYATHHIENGTDLVTLQLQLGHHKVTTTIKYVKFCKSVPRHIRHPIEKLNIKL